MRLLCSGLLAASWAFAQPVVPAVREPHHHTVYEDARVRILSAELEAGASTLLHSHDADYVWAALGEATLADTMAGRPEAHVQASDATVHFTPGGFAHVTRNEGAGPVHIVAVDVLAKQTNPRNVCSEVLPGEYLHCREPGPEWVGANLQIQFETDQTHVGILQIAPGATLAIPPFDVPPLLIALEGTEAQAFSHANGSPAGSGSGRSLKATNVLRSPADQVSEVRNVGKATARFLVVEFGGPGE